MHTISSKLLSTEKLTNDVFQYEFDFGGENVDFTPGQFFMINVEDGKEPPVNRSYSIASPPSCKDHFTLCIKLIEGGRASEYLREKKVGDSVEFMCPFGHFVLKDSKKDIVLISTGTGLAPFMSMLPVLFDQGFKGQITVLFGVRYEKDLFYMDKLKSWVDEHENMKLISTLSRSEEGWKGDTGRVTEHFKKMDLDVANTKIYICGNGHMVKEVRAIALEKGLEKTDIHFEQFTTL